MTYITTRGPQPKNWSKEGRRTDMHRTLKMYARREGILEGDLDRSQETA